MAKDFIKTREQLLEENYKLNTKISELEKSANYIEILKTSKQEINKHSQDLNERVKELQCIFGVSESIRIRDSLDEIFQDVVELIPKAWKYPGITRGRVFYDGKEYTSEDFEKTEWTQSSNIIVNGYTRGSIDIYYLEECPELNEGPFIKEERNLIDSIARNISEAIERKKAEEALHENESQLNALFTSMTEMVVIHELVKNNAGQAIDYRITDCNNVFSKVTGISKEDAIGKLASDLYQTDPPPFLEKYAKVAMGEGSNEFTTYYPALDKHFMISVVSPNAGKFATITTDISDMMLIQEKILAKNKEMENYLYIASHDLRTPLVNIQGFSQRFKKQVDSIKTLFAEKTFEPEILQQLTVITDEDIPKTLGFVHSNIEKMDTLINGLLLLSRTGRVEMNIQKIDMNVLFSKIIQNLDFQIKAAGCKISIAPLPEFFGDVLLLEQLFANIISNALKYSDSQRALEITVDGEKIYNRVLYTIKDNGIGIAQKYLDKIWDVFFRINPRSGKTGEGIGLSLVKRIAEKHKGKVWAESEENKGSVFNIELLNDSYTDF